MALRALFATLGYTSSASARDRLLSLRNKLQSGNEKVTVDLLDALIAKGFKESKAESILKAIAIGRTIEQMEIMPMQPYALAGKRQARRNARIARGRALTAKPPKAYFEAVNTELQAQAKRRDRINKETAYRAMASRWEESAHLVKKRYLSVSK